MCPVKQVLLKFSQNSQKNDCAGVSFIRKPQASGLQIYLKETPIRCFTVNFVKFLKRPILLNTYGRLLLDFVLRYRLIHHNEKTENINSYYPFRSSHQRRSTREGVLRNFTKSQENTCASLFFIKLQAWGLQLHLRHATLLNKRLAQVFSCELISKTFFTEHRWTTASIHY